MALLAYNLTTSPLTLAAGSVAALPASSASGARGPAVNVTAELNGLSLANYVSLQVQVTAGSVAFEWSGLPEYNVGALIVGSAQGDIAEQDVILYADPTIGNDGYDGTISAPLQTIEALMDRKPAIYKKSCRFYLNISATTSAQNTAKKVYTLSNQGLQFLFPLAEGKNAESTLIQGGWTNELGDLTATGGSTITLNTNQNFTLDQFKGAMIEIISGTGASTNSPRVIRSNTAGPNSIITPEAPFTVAPDNTSIYRISYPNVQLQYSQRLLFAAPPQNLFMNGIEFVFTGTGTAQDFQVGNMLGSAGGGAIIWNGIKWNGGSGGNKANLRVRGTARLQMDGGTSYWIGPNNPFPKADYVNTGNYVHDGAVMSTNIGGFILGGSGLIKNFTTIQAQSASVFAFFAGTIENAPIINGGAAVLNLSSLGTLRQRIRLITGTAITIQALGQGVANNGPGFNNVEFSDITGDMILVQSGGQAVIGDVTVAGTNTGLGLKVLTGGKARVQSSSLMAGNTGAIQIDTNPVMTLAQALATPFGGTLHSNIVMPYVITDPGDGYAISVVTSGICNLTSDVSDGYRTMAAPSYIGQKIGLCFDVDGGGDAYVTIATGFNAAGNTSIQFTDAGQVVFLEGVQVGGAKKWRMVTNDGATLS